MTTLRPAKGGKASRKTKAAKKTAKNQGRPPLPEVARSRLVEDESRRLLERVLVPWRVERWHEDFGVDAVVEISAPTSADSRVRVTGRLFAVQLKATDEKTPPSVQRIETQHLSYWVNHSLPVLLVVAHISTGTLRGRWIDGDILAELRERSPNFWSQGTVSIGLEGAFEITNAALPQIREYVERGLLRIGPVSPAAYFGLRAEAEGCVTRLARAVEDTGLATARRALADVQKTLRLGSYVVAIVGPQRAGKSTLVNALLGENLSPVGDFPTTGAPLFFEADTVRRAEAQLPDGSRVSITADIDSVKKAVAQQASTSMTPLASAVRVWVPNQRLALGITLVDSPGLGDADEGVRRVTEMALSEANAILFVVDAGLGSKFKLGSVEVDHLRQLEAGKERLFVVLNQSDLIDATMREKTRAYILDQFAKYAIGAKLVAEPLLVSAQAAFVAKLAGKQVPPEFELLEAELWGHLLRTGSTGIHRIHDSLMRIQRAAGEMRALVGARRNHGLQAAQLREAHKQCRAALGRIDAACSAWERDTYNALAETTAGFFLQQRGALAAHLASRPVGETPMSGDDLRGWIESLVKSFVPALGETLGRGTVALAARLNTIVREGTTKALRTIDVPLWTAA